MQGAQSLQRLKLGISILENSEKNDRAELLIGGSGASRKI
jgi:hypothetical protein